MILALLRMLNRITGTKTIQRVAVYLGITSTDILIPFTWLHLNVSCDICRGEEILHPLLSGEKREIHECIGPLQVNYLPTPENSTYSFKNISRP